MGLLGWLHGRLGFADTQELLRDLSQADEGFDADGRSFAFARLSSRRGDLTGITVADLERYDANIRAALWAMNGGRTAPVRLRYFQYLAALYTEIFLDHRFNHTVAFLASLNEHVQDRNLRRSPSEPALGYFDESDLDKLAFWMATGSGKTLLLHLNYRQFLHYSRETLDNIVLITPNEGLSEQHLAEMAVSNIPCRPFTLDGGGLLEPDTVHVTEITKLVLEKRGEGTSVPVEAFEGRNLIFVDEGHKGSGGDAWREVRDAIGATGFTFEYSATFGQALTAARNDALTEEYGKAIAFDYSYRHFYNDGHGKDFSIINLLQDPAELTDMLLLGNLLAFHEQHAVFRENAAAVRRYNIEQPLWALVGASVNAVYSENRRKRSDVLTAIRFLHRFLMDRAWAVDAIGELLAGRSGLAGTQGDLLADRFHHLRGRAPEAVYEDILHGTLHAPAGGALHLCDIARADGELGLKVAGAKDYFGLIYIGDTTAFKKLVQADDAGIVVEGDAISESLFVDINRPGTTIEVLIGARKFMEGWNSWRVSNMGLLNIGRSEGAQIIQMFGRGVRLQGLEMTLKRSSAMAGNHPAFVKVLETLNIFSLRANYMAKFREYLEREGVVADGTLELHLPIRANESWLKKELVVPRLDEDRDYQREVESVLVAEPDVRRVTVDFSGRAQAITSGATVESMDAVSGTSGTVPAEALDLIDWNAAYLDLVNHAVERGFDNLAISPVGLRAIIEDSSAYVLVAEERLTNPKTLDDMENLQRAVVAILCKYADRLYRRRRTRWESDHMHYRRLDEDDGNLGFNREVGDSAAKYIVQAPEREQEFMDELEHLLGTESLYEETAGEPHRIYFDRHIYQPLLVEKAGAGRDIKMSPPGLNESERRFVEDLKAYRSERSVVAPENETDVFLLRNLSRGKGVGFFEESGFYPDFILWMKHGGEQRIVFVEPHGMMYARPYAQDDKARLHEKLPGLARSMATPQGVSSVSLDSYIVSATPFEELRRNYDDGSWTRERFTEKHILFRDSGQGGYGYIAALFNH